MDGTSIFAPQGMYQSSILLHFHVHLLQKKHQQTNTHVWYIIGLLFFNSLQKIHGLNEKNVSVIYVKCQINAVHAQFVLINAPTLYNSENTYIFNVELEYKS